MGGDTRSARIKWPYESGAPRRWAAPRLPARGRTNSLRGNQSGCPVGRESQNAILTNHLDQTPPSVLGAHSKPGATRLEIVTPTIVRIFSSICLQPQQVATFCRYPTRAGYYKGWHWRLNSAELSEQRR